MFSSLCVFVGGKKWQNTIHSASYQLLISPHMKCKNDKLFECKLDILFGANAIQITIPCATVQQMLFGYEKERVFQARVIPNKRRKKKNKLENLKLCYNYNVLLEFLSVIHWISCASHAYWDRGKRKTKEIFFTHVAVYCVCPNIFFFSPLIKENHIVQRKRKFSVVNAMWISLI